MPASPHGHTTPPHTDDQPPSAERQHTSDPDGESTACPFCGGDLRSPNKCEHCGAHTDPLSRQATQNEMGPWFVRDEAHPFRPGCRLETIERWARTGRVDGETVIRGPSTNQNWTRAGRVPGIARLLGTCHACQENVEPTEVICGSCGASLETGRDRQHLGLSPVRALPGRTDPGMVASSLLHSQPVRVATRPDGPRSETRVTPAPPSNVDPPARTSRLDRRVKRAERRARLMTIAAVSFALLFAGSLVISRVGNGEPDATSAGPASAGSRLPDLLPTPADGPVEIAADSPTGFDPGDEQDADSGDNSEARRRLLESIETLVSSGSPDGLSEARRLLESNESGVLTADDIDRWHRRIGLVEESQRRSRVP